MENANSIGPVSQRQSQTANQYIYAIQAEGFGVHLNEELLHKLNLAASQVIIANLRQLPVDRELEKMAPPAVCVIGFNEQAAELIAKVRAVWPTSYILVYGDMHRIANVCQLLARYPMEFIPSDLAPAAIDAKISLLLGAAVYRNSVAARSIGKLTLNLPQRTVTNGHEIATLTPIEVKIVQTLADSLGGVVPRNEMKQLCWGDAEITDNALNRKIYEVRRTLRKLSEDINIRTIYGSGFELSIQA